MKSQLIHLKKLELLKELDTHRDGMFYAIIDSKLKNHLPQWVTFSPNIFWLKIAENEKNLEVYGQAVEFFLKQGITRSSTIYAIGGGAATDFAGFVAATILRGIKWVSIPTTLLGMIDGSIGGKVALNMPQGKNLVGAFHQPEKVYLCGDFLTTLTEEEWMSGKGEILKYGFLSKDINKMILAKQPIEQIALACAQYKEEVVDKDFLDKGDRIFLNLGHTLGHAFESSLRIPHGQAVGMGLRYVHSVMGLKEAVNHWEKMVMALDLPFNLFNLSSFKSFDLKLFIDFLEQDKKRVEHSIRIVLVKEIGACYIQEVLIKELKAKILDHEDFRNFQRAV